MPQISYLLAPYRTTNRHRSLLPSAHRSRGSGRPTHPSVQTPPCSSLSCYHTGPGMKLPHLLPHTPPPAAPAAAPAPPGCPTAPAPAGAQAGAVPSGGAAGLRADQGRGPFAAPARPSPARGVSEGGMRNTWSPRGGWFLVTGGWPHRLAHHLQSVRTKARHT